MGIWKTRRNGFSFCIDLRRHMDAELPSEIPRGMERLGMVLPVMDVDWGSDRLFVYVVVQHCLFLRGGLDLLSAPRVLGERATDFEAERICLCVPGFLSTAFNHSVTIGNDRPQRISCLCGMRSPDQWDGRHSSCESSPHRIQT